MKKTNKEIESEITALDNCKKYIPKRTFFGESNFEVIDAGVSALADRLTVDQAYDFAGDGEPSREDQARIDAALWMAGDNRNSPSSEWDQFRKP